MKITDFRRRIREYFKDAETNGTYPDKSGLIIALKLTPEEYDRLLEADDLKNQSDWLRHTALQQAELRRKSLLERALFTSTNATGRNLLLRQENAAPDAPPSFTIHIDGSSDFAD
ncbi:MAG: hypothetical protein LBO63_03405 [Oscillospiraceae bacterium]|jgi:hypothetical protein|nr:hypothetical protein [Oscillospiraceae bacterium]